MSATKKSATPGIKPGNKKRPPKGKVAPEGTVEQGVGESNTLTFAVVGVGSSAGGLDALGEFIGRMPPSATGMAFLLVQHLAPDKQSYMCDILSKKTSMPVNIMEDGAKIEPGHVYCNPPGKQIDIFHNTFQLTDLPQTRGTGFSIDHFLHSLAVDQGKNAIALIFSGTGTDGSRGIKEIKARGGLVMVQDPSQAEYDGMPESAIATGVVDYILPVEKIPEQLMEYYRHPYVSGPPLAESGDETFDQQVQKILMRVQSQTGHDFTSYKQNTIHRRIQRRMAVNQITETKDYLRYVDQNPAEVGELFQEMLIRVSSFFRDQDVFEALSRKIIPDLVQKKPPFSPVRIWVPGCSTGEEAYSLAIIFAEAVAELQKEVKIQIFASDIDQEAIEIARSAQYPPSIEGDVSADRLDRFFNKNEDVYLVKREIREMVIFAVQNLISDPPYSKLDLISCRNLLIYLGQNLQKKVFPLFHYVLNPDGYLLVGSSESIGSFSDLFSTVDGKNRIFQRKQTDHSSPGYTMPCLLELPEGDVLGMKSVRDNFDVTQLAERLILMEYGPPCVLVNSSLEIIYSHGPTDKYLALPEGKPSLDILSMARDSIRHRLRSALDKVSQQNEAVFSEDPAEFQPVDLVVKPIPATGSTPRLIMVVFQARTPSGRQETGDDLNDVSKKTDDGERIAFLKQELITVREELQRTVVELQASNEELLSTNEEAQSTNEELETSREELQSTNEELSTVNTELQRKVDELSQQNDDMINLLASTEIGTLFLDQDFRIKRFTPPTENLLNLVAGDVGRPVSSFRTKFDQIELEDLSRRVLDTLQAVRIEAQTKDGKWYSVRIRPYRTAENMIGGLVITFVDISELKEAEAGKIYAENIIDTLREPILVLSSDFKVLLANRTFYQKFRTSAKETMGRQIYELGNRQWDTPKLRELLEEVIPHSQSFDDFAVSHDFPEIGSKEMLLNARIIQQPGSYGKLILLSFHDITDGGQ